jgi:ribose transport system ATP-binding protein
MEDKAVDQTQTLVVRNMSMTFGGQRALDEVNVSIRRGEVHGLVGQNGCGKSTLIKILAGYHHPDPGGELEIDGRPVKLPVRTGSASELGLSFVHQDLGLLPTLTVVENFRAWTISTEFEWFIRWDRERERTEEAFARFGLSCDPRAVVGELPAVQRALLAIVRALDDLREYTKEDDSRGGLLILDEPTVFLPRENRDRLFDVVRRSVAQGASVLFVSHDLDEALAVTDRITVLRDGRVAGTVVSADTEKGGLIEMIIGKRLEAFEATHREHTVGEGSYVSVDGVTGGTIKNVSFTLDEGEVLGLTGLVGSGFEELPYQMFGATPAVSGRMTIAGVEHDLAAMSPPDAIKAGMALIPADRQGAAGIGSLLVRENVMMQVIDQYRPYRLDRRRYLRDAAKTLRQYDVRPPEPIMDFQALSGGNQQKVVLAKWLQAAPKVLLVHEPTQGVDVGARLQVFETITQAATQGQSVVCVSSDYEQLATICDRVLIFHDGQIMSTLVGDQITKDRITEQCYMSAHTLRPDTDMGIPA